MSMQTYFKSLFGANYLNGICWWSDPDDVQLRPPLTYDEAVNIATTISLSGQAYILSDFMDEPPPKDRFKRPLHQKITNRLPADRLDLYRRTIPAVPIHAMDLYPYRCDPVVRPQPASFPRILDLKVNGAAGMYDVAALYNWDDEPARKTLALTDDLGLEPGMDYLVYDYWNGDLLGSFKDTLSLDVPSHGVRALVIHPLLDKPVVLATSRHLTGTVSLQEMKWDASEKVLSGRSKLVEGDPYTLYIYVPEGMSISKTDASMKNGSGEINVEVKLRKADTGSFAAVKITGKGTEMEWRIMIE
jgi:hypothetical protein